MINKFLYLLIITSLLCGLNSCRKDPVYSVRLKNELKQTLRDVKVGDIAFPDIKADSISEYKEVGEGNLEIYCHEDYYGAINGSIDIKGKTSTNWTITIQSNREIKID